LMIINTLLSGRNEEGERRGKKKKVEGRMWQIAIRLSGFRPELRRGGKGGKKSFKEKNFVLLRRELWFGEGKNFTASSSISFNRRCEKEEKGKGLRKKKGRAQAGFDALPKIASHPDTFLFQYRKGGRKQRKRLVRREDDRNTWTLVYFSSQTARKGGEKKQREGT